MKTRQITLIEGTTDEIKKYCAENFKLGALSTITETIDKNKTENVKFYALPILNAIPTNKNKTNFELDLTLLAVSGMYNISDEEPSLIDLFC